MNRNDISFILLPVLLFLMLFTANAAGDEKHYYTTPPFTQGLLAPLNQQGHAGGRETASFNPKNPYNIFINYELGMHCVGFDISYCCIIPPYNSVQAQAVRSGQNSERPLLLSPGDGVRLYYEIRDNSYSEGNKMKYWQVPKDVTGNGTMNDPGDNIANYVWNHLFIYSDLAGTLPANPIGSKRLHIGREIPVNIDSGPSGKPVSGGYLDFAPRKGGNIVFTDSMIAELGDVPLKLTSAYIWDALGLPLTAFNDSTRKGSIRTITDLDFQPYQYAVVQLRDDRNKPVTVNGRNMEFFGTDPIDISNCIMCHSGKGKAAELSRLEGLVSFDKEYRYWKKNYPDVSEYMARLSATTIDILELHDRRHRTAFLREYSPDAPSNRLGSVGPVNCADCHGQNISGNLRSPRPGATGYTAVKAKPLTEVVHYLHAKTVPMPDKAGRTQNCQTCHPSHWQNPKMNDLAANPFQITDEDGNPRFSNADLRTSGGGCFLRRDAHTNPEVKPPFFLNEIGLWYLGNVSLKDEQGKPVKEMRGLYCTNCHNNLAHELYRYDDFRDPVSQLGKTLRNRAIAEVIKTVAGGNPVKFKTLFADPVTGVEGEPLYAYYASHAESTLLRYTRTPDGRMEIFPWNAGKGEAMSYRSASAGNDWWLSPAEPHCADCHLAPFVESEGGSYFPIDQPGKYSLYRYSKAHGVLACQSCHESMHGLYPVRHDDPGKTVDQTSHEQALQFSPDGKYAGPVTCGACHTVNLKGIPTLLKGTEYLNDYWASVVLIHFMRDGDQTLPIAQLAKKYPFARSKQIAAKGWNR